MKGIIAPSRTEAYSLVDGRSSSLPSAPGTWVPSASKVGSHDLYHAPSVPPTSAVAVSLGARVLAPQRFCAGAGASLR